MRSARLIPISFLLVASALAGCPGPRQDDQLEPNDTLATATPLVLGEWVNGRANQGDPDVFSIDVPAGETLFFAIQDRGLEECPGFTVQTSETDILYDDASGYCGSSEPFENGAELTRIEGFGYEIRVPETIAGKYYLTILEGSAADNIAPFSWDYALRAILDESVAPPDVP